MITIPNSLLKNQVLTFYLDKTALFSAVSDEYFSIEANVKKVVFVYKSEEGHQRKRIEFLIEDSVPSDSVTFSLKAKNVFELEQIVLIDYDGGTHVLPSTTVSVSQRTLTLTEGEQPPSSTIYFAFDGTSGADLGGFGSVYDPSVGGEFL